MEQKISLIESMTKAWNENCKKEREKTLYQQNNLMDWQKDTKSKPHMYTVMFEQFPKALMEVVKCSELWHKKYELDGDWQNFKRVPNPKDYLEATLRHLGKSKWTLTKSDDGDIYHLAQCAWNLLAYLEICIDDEGRKEDISIKSSRWA